MKLEVQIETSPILRQPPGCRLSELRPGDSGRIQDFGSSLLSKKFISMGILPGAYLRLVRKMPLSGPYYVQVNNSFFALRKQEAANIIIGK